LAVLRAENEAGVAPSIGAFLEVQVPGFIDDQHCTRVTGPGAPT
jgi:hypothetical protein